MQGSALLQPSAHRQVTCATCLEYSKRQKAAQRLAPTWHTVAWQRGPWTPGRRQRPRNCCPASTTTWPASAVSRPRRARVVVNAATGAAAATASLGDGALGSAQQPSSFLEPQHLEQSRQHRPVSPRLGRQLWQLLSPDWVKLLCVAACTLLSVVCTVSIGPAVGRGSSPLIACSASLVVCAQPQP